MALQESVAARNNKLDAEVYGPASAQGSTIANWVASTSYTTQTSWVINGGNVYLCTTSGTSAGSGGPTTTSSNITDNTAHWTYIGPAGIGPGPTLTLYNGTEPATCATALSGNTVLATGTLPAAWLAAASAGAKALSGTWTLTGAAGAGSGTAASFFRIIDLNANVAMQGTVGQSGVSAWVATTAYTIGQKVANGGNVYQCTTGGTSAGSGGPSGTGSGIADNTVVWAYYCVSGGDMPLNNNSIVNAQSVSITSFTVTAGNA